MMLLAKIHDLLAFGIDVKFSREINQFRITLSKENEEEQTVVLPYDHLSEKRICDYINLMQEKFSKKKDERKELTEFIMTHNFKDDDPKNDDSNLRYLKTMGIERLKELKDDYVE